MYRSADVYITVDHGAGRASAGKYGVVPRRKVDNFGVDFNGLLDIAEGAGGADPDRIAYTADIF